MIRVGGSDDVYPLIQTMAHEFEKQRNGYRIAFTPPAHTRGGAAGVAEGKLDIGLLSRPLSPEEKARQGNHMHLADDVLVFAVHHRVAVRSLTSQRSRACPRPRTT